MKKIKIIISNKNLIDISVRLLFYTTLSLILLINIYYSSKPLLEEHAFRQTQTALTTYYLKRNGLEFNYLTPVIGEPYSIPFEFPIFQLIVASISTLISPSLDQVGRIVNLIFTILTLIPAYKILEYLGVKKRAIYISISLFLSSPIYIFWSGTFMIEGAALFFLVCFIYYFVLLVRGKYCFRNIFLLSIFLTLGSLQKITTIVPNIIIIFLYLFYQKYKNKDFQLFKYLYVFILPLMIGSLWILYSDYIKIQNPIGSFLTSVNLSHWNYGTFSQRISKELWLDIIYTRNIEKNSASLLGLIFISILLINRKIKAPKKIIALSLAFYILPLLIFTNLHIVHNYYQTSNSIFYSVALGISICYVLDWYISKNKFLYITILLLFITSNYYYFYTEYSEKKIQLINAENSRTLSIAEYIKNNTSNEGPIIVFGYDWSSEIAYYSERKSLTIPAWGNFEFEAINDTRKFLSQSPSSYIVCPVENYSKILDLINKKYPESKVKMVSDCTIFLL